MLGAWLLAAWSMFVWTGRVRNIAADDVLVGGDRVLRFALSGSFIVLGLAALAGLVLAYKQGELLAWARGVILVLSLYSIITWVIRVIDISFAGDHELAFIAVHAVLAIVSIGLSYWALNDLRGPDYSSTQPSDARISA